MKRSVIIAFGLGIIISAFLSITVGLFEIPDAFFYYVLGQFLYTGYLSPVAPLNAAIPQTLFAPVYGLVVYPIIAWGKLGGPLVLLPFIQLVLLMISSFLIWKCAQKLFHQQWSKLTLVLFILLPFNLIYPFFFMSETFTMFLVSCVVATFILLRKNRWHYGLLILLSCILVLTRYAFLPLLALSVLYWVVKQKKQIVSISSVPAVIGLLLIGAWVLFHVHYYHSPRLSTFTGRHLYDNVISSGKFIPKKTDIPDVKSFLSYTYPGQKLDVPWWDIEPSFSGAFYQGKLSELDIDHLFFAYSMEGIKENIIPYIVHLFALTVITPNTPPYHDNVLSQIGFTEKDCTTCGVRQCRFPWMSQYCKPPQENGIVTKIFGFWMLGTKAMYPIITTILLVLAIVGVTASVVKRHAILFPISLVFLAQHFFQSASEWVEGRFLIPMYPLYVLLIIYGMIEGNHFIMKLKKSITHQRSNGGDQE